MHDTPPAGRSPLYVIQPDLPPLEEFVASLERIRDSKFLTDGGHFHQQLEAALCDYLGVEHVALFNNGTTALLTALQALGIQGEVITTPYSFVATSHALLWNGLQPVFADIDPVSFNLDPDRIEAIARKHGLKGVRLRRTRVQLTDAPWLLTHWLNARSAKPITLLEQGQL